MISSVLSRHTSNLSKRRRRHSIKHFKIRYQKRMKRYSTLKIFKFEVKEVAGMVEVVKTTKMKIFIRRRDSRAKQIGVEEDAVEVEAADQSSSVTNVKNMVIMRMIVTPINVTIVAEWGTLQKPVVPKKGGRSNQPSLRRRNRRSVRIAQQRTHSI